MKGWPAIGGGPVTAPTRRPVAGEPVEADERTGGERPRADPEATVELRPCACNRAPGRKIHLPGEHELTPVRVDISQTAITSIGIMMLGERRQW